jgi:hypothetical protein
MGDIMFLGGHSNRGGDGVTSKVSHFLDPLHQPRSFDQLRRAIGNFSSFVLVRVVRLVVETNALSGTCLSESQNIRASNFMFSHLGHRNTCSLCHLPRKSNQDTP